MKEEGKKFSFLKKITTEEGEEVKRVRDIWGFKR